MVLINQLMIRHKHGEDIYPTKDRQTAWDTFWVAAEESLCSDFNYDDTEDADFIQEIQDYLEAMQEEHHDTWFAVSADGKYLNEEFHIESDTGDFFTCVWYESELFMPVPDMPGFRQHSSVVDYETQSFLTFLLGLKYAKMQTPDIVHEPQYIIILARVLDDPELQAALESYKVSEQPEAYAALHELHSLAVAADAMGYHYVWMTLSDDVDTDQMLEDGSASFSAILSLAGKATSFNIIPARVVANHFA